MKKKKNKGASLVVVIMVTSIIFSLGIAMLSMSVAGYKARLNESKRLQSLYESDSGLDVIYNIIRKTSGVAIQKAGKDVEKITNVVLRNDQFKDKFLAYLEDNTSDLNLEKCIENWEYPVYDEVAGTTTFEHIDSHDGVIREATIVPVVADKRLNVTATTTFSSPTNQFPNTRTIEGKFVIDAPDYSDVIISISRDVPINPVYEGKIITADGDMESRGNLTVNGDIWVQGSDKYKGSNLKNYSYDKYQGGITLEDGLFTFKDDKNIYTSRTFNLKNESTAEVSGNIYSSNTYLGSITKGGTSANTKLTAKDVITYNDLALNSKDGEATMVNYYGINDKTSDESAKANVAASESSCIIVNNPNSKLTISAEALIMGLAYIDVTDTKKYQTGESVAVKGNYVAYTDPGTEANVTLKYYNPLQLIEGKDFTLGKKIDQFISYYDNSKNPRNQLNRGNGITLPSTIYSAGAYVSGDSALRNLPDAYATATVLGKQSDYAINVLSMGDAAGIGKSVQEIYDGVQAVRTVDHQVDFTAINGYDNDRVIEDYGKVILNTDSNKTIRIQKNGKVKIDNVYKDFQATDMMGLIVTQGDVIVEAGVKFTGNIITTKNVIVEGNNDTTNLIYNPDVIYKIYAINKPYFDKIFRYPSQGIRNVKLPRNRAGDLSDYYEKDFIKKGEWKIVK